MSVIVFRVYFADVFCVCSASAHVPDLEQGLDRMRLQQCTQNEGGRIEPGICRKYEF